MPQLTVKILGCLLDGILWTKELLGDVPVLYSVFAGVCGTGEVSLWNSVLALRLWPKAPCWSSCDVGLGTVLVKTADLESTGAFWF